MAKKSLAGDVINGDQFRLPVDCSAVEVMKIEDDPTVSTVDNVIITVRCNEGPFKGAVGKLRISPVEKITLLKRAKRPSVMSYLSGVIRAALFGRVTKKEVAVLSPAE